MPDIVVDIVLGLVQGVAEFLPVSSSGHLVVVPAILGWEEPELSFDLMLHVGTLLAVVVYFWSDLRDVALAAVSKGERPEEGRRLLGLILLATVPAAVVGLTLEDPIESLFEEPLWVCGFWLVTAAGLVAGERLHRRAAPRELTVSIALLVGSAQALALAPGISRSGATIVTGLALGLSRHEAARFAFLLAIPAIGGGALTLVPDILDGTFRLTGPVLAGFTVAALSGYLAVAALLRMVRARSLAPFAVYLVVVAPLAAVGLQLD